MKWTKKNHKNKYDKSGSFLLETGKSGECLKNYHEFSYHTRKLGRSEPFNQDNTKLKLHMAIYWRTEEKIQKNAVKQLCFV